MPHNPHMPDDPKEFLEERKAIMQYEGNLPQDKAEVLAYTRYIHKYRPDMITWYPCTRQTPVRPVGLSG